MRIQSEQEYEAALKRIYSLSNAEPNTPESTELDELVREVNDFEDREYPIIEPGQFDYEKIRRSELWS